MIMSRTRLLFLLMLISFAGKISAQMVGTNCYLQGRYLEIGMCPNGAFGTCNPQGAIPAGYHPHTGATPGPSGTNLAEVYDWGKDGWAVGTPPFMGDYTYPGSPFEGWELQIGAGRVQAFQSCTGFMTAAGGMTMTGAHSGYTNIGGSARGVWTGTGTMAGATLSIRQETRVDTLASAVVVTTLLRNTGGVVAPNVYYLRSCDPDNAQTWSSLGGGFPTVNRIVHQNEDARHRVLVKSYDNSLGESRSYMGLGTKDCRAKCFIYTSWSLGSTIDLSTVWNQTYGAAGTSVQYNLGACLPVGCTPQDIAIGLVYRIGNIAPGDSAVISYAYIFDGDAGIDGAFPDPRLAINGMPRPVTAHPAPTYDTFDVCAVPGTTSINVDILNVIDKTWTWSRWTWAPSIGLATTTGVSNVINTSSLPPVITYTITGTDSAIGMTSCLNKVFYLTLITCNGAEANSPCEGDTLWLNAPGDSTAATYQWYGPAPSTSIFATSQRTFLYPAAASMNGVYHVIKTVFGVPDTSDVTVTIRHKPVVSASSNAPLCIGAANTLLLNAVTDSPVVSYSWSASPPSFTSTMSNPSIPGFDIVDTGLYTVIVQSAYGCKDTTSTYVTIIPPPPPPVVVAVTPYCKGDAFVPFTVTGVSAGATVRWYTAASGGTPSGTTPTINTSVPGVYTHWFSQIIGSCESFRDSVVVTVNPTPVADFNFIVNSGCPSDTVTFTNASVGATSNTWTFGDGQTGYEVNPIHLYNGPGDNFNVILRVINSFGCVSVINKPIDTRNRIIADFSVADTMVCNGTPVVLTDLSFFNRVPTYTVNETVMSTNWDFGDGNGTIDGGGVTVNHTYAKPGYYQIKLTATDSIGCVAEVRKNVVIIQPVIRAVSDTTFCLPAGVDMQIVTSVTTQPDEIPGDTYSYNWTPATSLSSDVVKDPYFSGLGVFVYTFTATLTNEGCSQSHVVTINSVPPTRLTDVTLDTRITLGNSIRLNADSHEFYRWFPNDGSLDNYNINNPVATPTVTTTYMVQGMDKYGCRDTAYVTVLVDSTQQEFIPTGFTPNGDGKNDVFRAVGSKFQKLLEMRVYNRWGQQVFYTNNREVGWDGTYEDGKNADIGTYYYTIIVARPGYHENIVYKGEVTLIR